MTEATAKRTHISREFVIERSGKEFILYAGLLHAAHERGLQGISTRILQIGDETNGQTWLIQATATFADGSKWDGIGDASPANVARAMLTVLPRLCETRSKARALRDACDIGVAAFEELGPDGAASDDDDTPPHPVARQTPQGAVRMEVASESQRAMAQGSGPAASDKQVAAIFGIAKGMGWTNERVRQEVAKQYSCEPEALTTRQASEMIGRLNSLKG